VKALLFDLDGTLIDSEEAVLLAYNRVLREAGFRERPKTEMMPQWGRDSWQWFSALEPLASEKTIDKMARNMQKLYASEYLPKYAKPEPGAVEILRQLKAQGKRLAIVTNQVREEAEATMRVLCFHEFDAVVTHSDVAQGKPNPEMIFKALSAVGAAKQEAIFVGDSRVDWLTGEAAGINTRLILRPWNASLPCKKISAFSELLKL